MPMIRQCALLLVVVAGSGCASHKAATKGAGPSRWTGNFKQESNSAVIGAEMARGRSSGYGTIVLTPVADQERRVKAQADIKQIVAALNLYRLDHFKYPSADEGLQALVTPPADPNNSNAPNGGYLDKPPMDPWQHPYQYLNPGVHGEVDVMSYGRDGQPGGEGYDADIGSWEI